MPDAQTQPRRVLRRSCPCASRSAPDRPGDGLRARDSAPPPPVPRPTCSASSIRWPRPRPIRDACFATSTSRTARWSLRGSSVDLEELGGVGVGLGAAGSAADRDPHVPARLPGRRRRRRRRRRRSGAATRRRRFPSTSACSPPTPRLPVAELAVPALPKLLAINGSAPAAGLRVDTSGGLTLSLGAAGGSLVELRPFGATVVVSCAVPTNALDRGAGHRARARCSPTCARAMRTARSATRASRCRSSSRAGSARVSRS